MLTNVALNTSVLFPRQEKRRKACVTVCVSLVPDLIIAKFWKRMLR